MQRNLLIDIAKCLLIFLVVLGHMPEGSSELHRYIFWFHMPAFFIISGLFLRKEFSLKEEVKKKALRLLVPYAAFSIVFGTVARHGNLPKQIIGTLISAGGIITDFTFPYYFITVLFLAYVFIYVLRKYSNHELLWVIAAYVVTHFLALFAHDKLNWVPWNVDMALCASLYLYVGSKYRNIVTENQG